MKSVKLGNFEELVLLLVGALYNEAYSVNIVEEYQKQTGKKINVSAIHTVLYRLEEKGFLDSKMSEPTAERGGKRKRLFYLTPYAQRSLDELASIRARLRSRIAKNELNWNAN
ncbi:MAG: PadR family transcriptional regulator [Bacteroidota bacterium]